MDLVCADTEMVRRLKSLLVQVELLPFQDWSRLMMKGMTLLRNENAVRIGPGDCSLMNVNDLVFLAKEGDKKYVEIEEMIEPDREALPYDLIVLEGSSFVPTMDLVNQTGEEIIEQLMNFG
jgi:hypothetical protein